MQNSTFRHVVRSDGSVHLEHQAGTMRFDLTDGSISHVISGAGSMQTVIRPDGSTEIEHQTSNMRVNISNGSISQLW